MSECSTEIFRSAARVLIMAPHHDDEAIGCGGLILQYKQQGAEVACIYAFDPLEGVTSVAGMRRLAEANAAAQILGFVTTRCLGAICRQSIDPSVLVWRFVEEIRVFRPNVLLIPHQHERDPEHQFVHNAAVEALWLSETAFRSDLGLPAPPVSTVLGYEVWTPISLPQLIVDITSQLPRKLEAINAYASQVEARDYASGSAGLSRYRGVMMGGCEFAEAYSVIRIRCSLGMELRCGTNLEQTPAFVDHIG